jgi:hypothetical protein
MKKVKEIKARHICKIEITPELLLEILDFKGGTIWGIKLDEDYTPPRYIKIALEHPDLPEVKESDFISNITPIMQITYGDNGVPLRIERTDPPKKT